jgi:hypothetical protein
MKQLLVPALLLLFVGAAAAGAASTRPAVVTCPPTPTCPYMDERCVESGAARGACPAAAQDDSTQKCEDEPQMDCCKKKMECGQCKKNEPKTETPAERP